MVKYNRSTGILWDGNNMRKKIELTVTEMKIAEELFDWKWHKMKDLEEITGIEGQRRRVNISRLKKKIKRYIELKIDRKGRRYRCERIKKEKEKR